MDLGLLRRIVVDLLLLPPGSIVVALLLGLLISKRWPRTGRAVLWSATVALYLLSTSLVSTTLARMTGDHAPFTPSAVGQAKAIVILAAEQNEAPEYGGLTVGDLTLERLRLGAKVALLDMGEANPVVEAVADAIHGGDDLGVGGVHLELATQVLHVRVDRAVRYDSMVRIQLFQQPVSRMHAARFL